jgi:hypothetical protein
VKLVIVAILSTAALAVLVMAGLIDIEAIVRRVVNAVSR